MILYEVIGWIGMILLISAFQLVSSGKLKSNSAIYQTINLLGASGIAINAFAYKAWPSFGLQLVWGLTALMFLAKHYRK